MAESVQDAAPKRLTGEAAFLDAKKKIAERNEATQREARKARAKREERKAAERRTRDLL